MTKEYDELQALSWEAEVDVAPMFIGGDHHIGWSVRATYRDYHGAVLSVSGEGSTLPDAIRAVEGLKRRADEELTRTEVPA